MHHFLHPLSLVSSAGDVLGLQKLAVSVAGPFNYACSLKLLLSFILLSFSSQVWHVYFAFVVCLQRLYVG